METTIKQSEQEKSRMLDQVKTLYDSYEPLKEHVDILRVEIGLDRLPALASEDDKLTPE